MAKQSSNNVKPPVAHSKIEGAFPDGGDKHTIKESLTEQHHGEDTTSPQDDRNIGQHNGAGRPPLMKK